MFKALTSRSSRRLRLALWAALAVIPPLFLLSLTAVGQGGSANSIPRDDVQACLACHSQEMGGKHAVQLAALNASPHKDLKCQDCHATITAAPHTPEMLKTKAECATCHSDEHTAYTMSVHSHADKVPGDHPTCASCHGNGDPHAVRPMKTWTRKERAELCSTCHGEVARMNRYGVDPDAVPSYNESFHGKAQKFGLTRAAICSDCHKNHDVLAPSNPKAPTNRANADKLCSQAGCHAGATINVAMSGANHLRLIVKKVPLLRMEEIFFQFLTISTILFLLGGVALDLRTRVFSKNVPPSGRAVAAMIGVSFVLITTSLAMAFFHVRNAEWVAVAAASLLVIAFVIFSVQPKSAEHGGGRRYERFTVVQRVQHIILMVSFTLLVLTGLPLRFPTVDWLKHIYTLFGGIANARLTHRGAAVALIADWIWHTGYLVVKWAQAGFKLSAMTMLPSWKDVKDFIGVSLFYLGLSHYEPKYDRFQFREKFDYFAVYWGMPIMVFSGLVLWFPIYFGNRLPELGLSVAYIAHSDEAVLALLVIALWHMYNVHLSPDRFPMSKAFYTGTMTEEEMRREHPLELARMQQAEALAQAAPAPTPAPQAEAPAPPEPEPAPPAAEVTPSEAVTRPLEAPADQPEPPQAEPEPGGEEKPAE